MTRRCSSMIVATALVAVCVGASAGPAEAICGRKSCVVGSTPAVPGGGGGYDPSAGIGGMVDLMFGVMGAIQAQQQQMSMEQARALYARGNQLLESGDYVAAIAAYQQALRLMPGDPNILAGLERAQQALVQLRQQEAVRQAAEKAALQQRIAGIIGGLSGGFDGAARPETPSALDGVDFAPAGTSFFGTGGGTGGVRPSAAKAKAPPPPRSQSGAPSYGAANPPPQQTQGLDFVGAKDSLFERGHQGSATPALRDAVASPKSDPPPQTSASRQLDFSVSTAPAQPRQAATAQPDAITYRSEAPWAVRTFIQPIVASLDAAVATAPPQPASQPVKPRPTPQVKDFLPPEMAPKQPMGLDAGLDPIERRAHELANDAFDRLGTAQYDTAVRLFEIALEQAPRDTRIRRALEETRTVRANFKSDLEAGEDLRAERKANAGTTADVLAFYAARSSAAGGYKALHAGDYGTAVKSFSAATMADPAMREFYVRHHQARIGQILSALR